MTTSTRSLLVPGVQSPRRKVPAHIARPEYVDLPEPKPYKGSHVQTADTIERMQIAGKIAAQALAEVGANVRPGITTDELDRIGHEFLCDHNAYPSTLGYRHFPKSLCTSLNEVICHGIPDSTVVEDGDIVNIDITAYIHGVHGDTNATFGAGEVSAQAQALMDATREATRKAIRAVKPGRALNVIGRIIQSYVERRGYGVVRDFTGHGIGETFHSGLWVPHYDRPDLNVVMEPGMTFTIEPMITLGTYKYELWDDKWTVVTADRQWTAQWEHTLVVTETGSKILTLADESECELW